MGQGEGDDLARIERATSELRRLFDSRRIHESRMRGLRLTLSRTELRFLHRLHDLGPLSVSRLAAALDVSQPTASRSLRRLEDGGLVVRRATAEDGRVAIYDLTAKGRRIRRRVVEFTHVQLAGALADLPRRRRTDMANALEDLVKMLHDGGRATRTSETA